MNIVNSISISKKSKDALIILIVGTLLGVLYPLLSREDGIGPITPIWQKSKIRQGLLWASSLTLKLRQLIGELYQQFAITFPLVGRHHQDTSNIIVFTRFFFLGEVSNNMTAFRYLGYQKLNILYKRKLKINENTNNLNNLMYNRTFFFMR